jgi:hypothetical protein
MNPDARLTDEDRAAFDEATAATNRILAAQPGRRCDPTLPEFRFLASLQLGSLRRAFEAGHQRSLMAAIRVCANHDLPLPDWASKAYIHSYDQVLNARMKSWDEAFGAPYPKGTNLAATRKHRILKSAVVTRVQAIRASEPGTPIDEDLFERLGAELHIGKTLASKLYYSLPAWRRLGLVHNRG